MSYNKYFLVPEKNVTKFCHDLNKKKVEEQKTSLENKSTPNILNRDSIEKPLQIKQNSDRNETLDDGRNNVENSNLLKDKKVPKLEAVQDLEKKTNLTEEAPPPGLPSTKRKRVIEGNTSFGAGFYQSKNQISKIPKKINWIQL